MNMASDNVTIEDSEDLMTELKNKVDKVIVSGSQQLLNTLPREKLVWMLQRMCEIRYF